MFYNIIYNPHVYVWDLNPKRTDFYSYIDFMKKRENLTIYKDEIIGFYKQVYNDTSDAEFFDNLKKITNYKPKIIVYINNLFIVSCMKLISALLVFLLRKYRKNWKKDMVPYFMVNHFFKNNIFLGRSFGEYFKYSDCMLLVFSQFSG